MAEQDVLNFDSAVSEEQHAKEELYQLKFRLNKKGWGPKRDTPYECIIPDETQISLYSASLGGRRVSVANAMKATLDLFEVNMPPAQYDDLYNRLLDPDDPVSITTLQDVLKTLIEEAQGFPTEPESDSGSSRGTTGGRSTASSQRAGSTPAPSRRAVSSTSSTRSRSRA